MSENRINYQESCFIINAMEYYLAEFKMKTNMSEKSINYYDNIIKKYIKLENQIMNLKIEEG